MQQRLSPGSRGAEPAGSHPFLATLQPDPGADCGRRGRPINANTFTYTVTHVQATLHMSARSGFINGILTNVIAIPAEVLGGWLSDRHRRRPVNTGGNLLFLLTIYPVFAWIVATRPEVVLFTAMTALSAVANFYIGSMYASLAEGLPKTIRSAGFGTVFAISIAVFGGTTPIRPDLADPRDWQRDGSRLVPDRRDRYRSGGLPAHPRN